MQKLKVYNKEIIDGQYPNGLAYSVHISIEGEPIHNEYGILFPKGSVDENNRIVPVFAGEFRVASFMQNSNQFYLITGENWKENGVIKGNERTFWAWITEDFISYEEWNLCDDLSLEKRTGISIDELRENYEISISDELADKIKIFWNEKPEKNIKYPKLQFPFSRGFGDPVFFLWKDDY